MSLLRKVRVLVGALVHKPFRPRPEKVDLGEEPDLPQKEASNRRALALEAQEQTVEDSERVADLIAKQRRDEAG